MRRMVGVLRADAKMDVVPWMAGRMMSRSGLSVCYHQPPYHFALSYENVTYGFRERTSYVLDVRHIFQSGIEGPFDRDVGDHDEGEIGGVGCERWVLF